MNKHIFIDEGLYVTDKGLFCLAPFGLLKVSGVRIINEQVVVWNGKISQ